MAVEQATGRGRFAQAARAVHVDRARDAGASKDEILELYLNDVYLGQRGSFAIHGVAEASRLFFGKDVTQPHAVEAATIAGVIQSPPLFRRSTIRIAASSAATSC